MQTLFTGLRERGFESTEPFSIELAELCGGDKMAPIKFLWKTVRMDPEVELDSVLTNVAELESGK